MKIINEAKQEKLPIDFITQFVSKGWEEVGNLKASCDAIKKEFKDTKAVEDILQGLIDSYLIALGQMELHLDKKDYVELPEREDLKEALTESNEAEAQPIEAKKFEDENKTEIFTELPDYDVEVEQKGSKVEVEVEPKNANKDVFSFDDFDDSELVMSDEQVARVNEPFDDEWPEPVGGGSDIADAKAALSNGELQIGEPEIQVVNDRLEDEIRDEMPVPEFVKDEGHSEEPVEIVEPFDFYVDFPEIDPKDLKKIQAEIED